jgi:hypothetical protein
MLLWIAIAPDVQECGGDEREVLAKNPTRWLSKARLQTPPRHLIESDDSWFYTGNTHMMFTKAVCGPWGLRLAYGAGFS